MAEQEPTPEQLAAVAAANDEESTVNYRPPAQKTLKEIQELDAEDESLRKYKEALLGGAAADVLDDPTVPNVLVQRMTLMCEGSKKELFLDLEGDLEKFKKNPIVLKEGVDYKVKITFKVNKEIVSGLRYQQETYRKGVKMDKSNYMVGSYGPRPNEAYHYLTPVEEAPKGILARGSYTIKSKFTDDDKHDHLIWEWILTIKKEWED